MATGGTVLKFRYANDVGTSGQSDEPTASMLHSTTSEPPENPSSMSGAWSVATTVAAGSELATLQDLGNGLILVHPLHVRLERQPGVSYAVSLDVGLIGEGESDFDAIEDLRTQVGELYQSLIELRETLGPRPRMQLAFLDRLAGISR